jgi:hypothetical protein
MGLALLYAPRPGLEPGTIALTGRCSTIELPRNIHCKPSYPRSMVSAALLSLGWVIISLTAHDYVARGNDTVIPAH